MVESKRLWATKMTFPFVAVLFAFATYAFGNGLIPSLREGYAILLYLAVILGTEIVDHARSSDLPDRDERFYLGLALVIGATILYVLVVVFGVLAPTADVLLVVPFYACLVLGSLVSLYTIGFHLSVKTFDPAKKKQEEDDDAARKLQEEAKELKESKDGTKL